MEKKKLDQEVQNELVRADIAAKLIELGIEEEWNKHGIGVVVLEDRVEIYREKELALMDIFKGKKMTETEYSLWLIEMIRKQFGYA